MIKRLQRKFVLIAITSLFIVELIIIGAVNAVSFYNVNKEANNLLRIISDNGGDFPDFFAVSSKNSPTGSMENTTDTAEPPKRDLKDNNGFDAETKYQTRYFSVTVNSENTITQIDTGHVAAITSDEAKSYAYTVIEDGDDIGFYDHYKYLVTTTDNGGKLIIFVDCNSKLATAYSFLGISCAIAFAGLVLVSILVAIFSKRAIRPAVESMEKQKQFITDAGHEIKTPLAIISANTEVIELTSGESEWTDSIKNQAKRLNELVQKLLTLTKMEEDVRTKLVFEDFNMSDAVIDTASPFETLAQTKGKKLSMNVENDIVMHGDEAAIRQLVSILTENAVKYADEGSEVMVSLKKSAKSLKGIKLKVHNACQPIPKEDLNRLFDRFYRADSSRARETGGYGIGLSIARAIVESHKGKIAAVNDGEGISFIIRF